MMTNAETAVVEKENELYEHVDPDFIPEDVVVNVIKRPALLPKDPNGDAGGGSVILKRGDRVRGAYYASMVVKDHIPGLQLACKLTEKNLTELEKERQEREGLVLEEWQKDARRKLNK